MSVIGSLTDFSLPEIFQFVERGKKTGLVTLRSLPDDETTSPQVYYIWVYQGRIVAAANQLENRGLVSLINQRQWVSDRVIVKLAQLCPTTKPLGLYLKNHGVLQAEQLKRLFQIQVLQQVCALFKLKDGQFRFDTNAPLPTPEMTGLSVPATEATLMGLRVLRSWDALADKLPDPNSGLASVVVGQLHYRLDTLEWQVWEYTKGSVSLKAISRQLRIPVEKVQQVAFRLITIGLAEEVPLLVGTLSTQTVEPSPSQLIDEDERQGINPSFLQNLVGFLRSKVAD